MKNLFFIFILFIIGNACKPYDRSNWKHWIDADKDCQNTRQEVLIEESMRMVKTDSNFCKVLGGGWYDPYTNMGYTDPSKLDIDHLVPLKEAYESGAWEWSSDHKTKYANYLKNSNHLIAVYNRANRSKGARDPAEWMPPNVSYHEEYLRNWIDVKMEWGLSIDSVEYNKIYSVLGDDITYPEVNSEYVCDETVVIEKNCCRTCRKGRSKACGDVCISLSRNCTKTTGCACNEE